MTEQFGMCGTGWKYEVDQIWNEPLQDGQVLCFAKVMLTIGEGSPIPGIGGSMLVEKEKEGLHASDEGYKMAITDALSVAMKMIGMGANIYAGLSDGSKYSAPTKTDAPPDKTEHFCKEHNVKFFKTEKMRGYAHPIADTKEWCNEPEQKRDTPPPAKPTPDAVQSKSGASTGKRDPSTITNLEKLAAALQKDYGLSYQEQWNKLEIASWNDLTMPPGAAYEIVALSMEEGE